MSFSEFLLFKDEKLYQLQRTLLVSDDKVLVADLQAAALNGFCEEENISLRYAANIDASFEHKV